MKAHPDEQKNLVGRETEIAEKLEKAFQKIHKNERR
jgi:hypothetical protein